MSLDATVLVARALVEGCVALSELAIGSRRRIRLQPLIEDGLVENALGGGLTGVSGIIVGVWRSSRGGCHFRAHFGWQAGR